MTFEVQQTRWDRLIRRVSGSIGPGSRVSETLSELFPVVDVERVPAELLILGGTGLAFGGGQLVSAAGETPTAQLFNPADSGQLITVTNIRVAFAVPSIVRWGITQNQRGAAIGTQVYRDSRRLLPVTPVGQITQDSAVAFASGTNQARIPANETLTVEDQNAVAVLAPGTGIEIGTTSLNTTINYSFSWRERPAERSELSL